MSEPSPESERSDQASGATSHEEQLLLRYHRTRDPRDRERLVEHFMPLARSLALRYRAGGEPVEDLIQVASLGLLKAIDRYEPERNTTFAAYASPTILGELRHHFRDHSWSVRLPRSLQERSMRIAEASQEISGSTHRPASVAEIAAACDLTELEVVEAQQADRARRTTSLDMPMSRGDGESATVVESIADDEAGFDRALSELASEGAVLRSKERAALDLRFHEGLTQREIGIQIGVSQMQVSRLLRAAMGKLLVAVRGGEELEASALQPATAGAAASATPDGAAEPLSSTRP